MQPPPSAGQLNAQPPPPPPAGGRGSAATGLELPPPNPNPKLPDGWVQCQENNNSYYWHKASNVVASNVDYHQNPSLTPSDVVDAVARTRPVGEEGLTC